MKWFGLLKYMVPGIIASIVTAIYFATGSGTFITIVLFCSLITYAIVTSNQISNLKEALSKLETKTVDKRVYKIRNKATKEEIEILNDKINFVAQAASSEISDLAENVGSEIHEIALIIADKKFGPYEDGED